MTTRLMRVDFFLPLKPLCSIMNLQIDNLVDNSKRSVYESSDF